jgi:hypothetical protein
VHETLRLLVVVDVGLEELERHEAVERDVARLVDLAHPAGAELLEDFVV